MNKKIKKEEVKTDEEGRKATFSVKSNPRIYKRNAKIYQSEWKKTESNDRFINVRYYVSKFKSHTLKR